MTVCQDPLRLASERAASRFNWKTPTTTRLCNLYVSADLFHLILLILIKRLACSFTLEQSYGATYCYDVIGAIRIPQKYIGHLSRRHARTTRHTRCSLNLPADLNLLLGIPRILINTLQQPRCYRQRGGPLDYHDNAFARSPPRLHRHPSDLVIAFQPATYSVQLHLTQQNNPTTNLRRIALMSPPKMPQKSKPYQTPSQPHQIRKTTSLQPYICQKIPMTSSSRPTLPCVFSTTPHSLYRGSLR